MKKKLGVSLIPIIVFPCWQVLQDSINIPGTSLSLVYSSSQADGYRSKLWIQMTGREVPKHLTLVRLRYVF